VYKLRIEERWMLAQFGEQYRDYQRASWALLPPVY
jgi:protein-S-isoprenylcysteine O-methyltransferase Ste14